MVRNKGIMEFHRTGSTHGVGNKVLTETNAHECSVRWEYDVARKC